MSRRKFIRGTVHYILTNKIYTLLNGYNNQFCEKMNKEKNTEIYGVGQSEIEITKCPHCGEKHIVKNGKKRNRQRYSSYCRNEKQNVGKLSKNNVKGKVA
jgi:predicted RNA-binding Zn-ribbon protein involved in translation (DUF1610 family)